MVKQALEESRGDLSGAASNKPTGAQEMVFGYKVDVSDRDEVFKVAGIMKEEVGVVDILVNNAGVVTGKHFLDTTDDENLRTMEINVISHFWVEIGALQFYSFQSHSITFWFSVSKRFGSLRRLSRHFCPTWSSKTGVTSSRCQAWLAKEAWTGWLTTVLQSLLLAGSAKPSGKNWRCTYNYCCQNTNILWLLSSEGRNYYIP